MIKIYQLFINENIKTWKKFSTKLVILLIILALMGVIALTQVLKYIDNQSMGEMITNYDWKESLKEEIKYYQEELVNRKLSDEERKQIETLIKVRELNLQYNIDLVSTNWKSMVLNQMAMGNEIDEKLVELIKNNDFSGYIQLQKDEYKQLFDNKQITKEEYNDIIEMLELRSKYEIGKDETENYDIDWREYILSDIEMMKGALREGKDPETNKVLTLEKMQEYEEKIKMYIYRIENNMPTIEWSNGYRMIYESLASNFVIVMIAIFAIIIAGGAISTEISTGTIKFWALTPNKRWKILTAKLLSIIFYIIVITLIMALLTIVCGNIFFETKGNEYIYIKDGTVKTIGNSLFIIEYYFIKIIPVIFFSIFAFMLSVITKNTSFSLGFALATYMGNGLVMSIVNTYIKIDWVKFIPFNNLKLAEKVFPNFENITGFTQNIGMSGSLGFSLIILSVCSILMLVSAYDSFNNKDIVG